MGKPKLTKEEEERFKELYLKGLSARYIFAELGQRYHGGYAWTNANSRMILYRKKLGLPKRGKGFKSIPIPLTDVERAELTKKTEQRRIKRINLLTRRIEVWNQRIQKWQEELDSMLVDSSRR